MVFRESFLAVCLMSNTNSHRTGHSPFGTTWSLYLSLEAVFMGGRDNSPAMTRFGVLAFAGGGSSRQGAAGVGVGETIGLVQQWLAGGLCQCIGETVAEIELCGMAASLSDNYNAEDAGDARSALKYFTRQRRAVFSPCVLRASSASSALNLFLCVCGSSQSAQVSRTRSLSLRNSFAASSDSSAMARS
jgi:hypothetical protein